MLNICQAPGPQASPHPPGRSHCLCSPGVKLASHQLTAPQQLPTADHRNCCPSPFTHSDASRGDMAVLQTKLVFLEQVPPPLLPPLPVHSRRPASGSPTSTHTCPHVRSVKELRVGGLQARLGALPPYCDLWTLGQVSALINGKRKPIVPLTDSAQKML